jgi:hypothetical protein
VGSVSFSKAMDLQADERKVDPANHALKSPTCD